MAIAQENATNTTQEEKTQVIKLDDYNTVKSYHIENKTTFVVTIKTERQTLVKVSDGFGGIEETGASNIPSKTMTLNEGTNTIRFDATSFKGYITIGISSPHNGIRLSERTKGSSIFDTSVSGDTSAGFFIVGTLMGITLVVGVAIQRRKNLDTETTREI